MNVGNIRAALADAMGLATLRVLSYVPDALNPPVAIIYPERIDYDETYGGAATATFVVLLVASTGSQQAAQAQMDDWVSNVPDSLFAALSKDPTLGGVVDSAQTLTLRSWGMQALMDLATRYLIAEFVTEVYA